MCSLAFRFGSHVYYADGNSTTLLLLLRSEGSCESHCRVLCLPRLSHSQAGEVPPLDPPAALLHLIPLAYEWRFQRTSPETVRLQERWVVDLEYRAACEEALGHPCKKAEEW